MAISYHIPTATLLSESILDTECVVGVGAPELPVILRLRPHSYPEWSWDRKKKNFKKTHLDVINKDMRDRADFAASKRDAIARAMISINVLRNKIDTGFLFQETIYATKEKQAQSLKDANFDEALAPFAPLVVQYAESTNTSLKVAAEDILLHAKFFHEHLEKTEKVRLSLFHKIKRAKNAEEIESVMKKFRQEGVI